MITKIDDVKMDDKGMLVRQAPTPIDVCEAIEQIRASYEPRKNIPLTPLEAASAGLRFSYQDRDGKIITVNPDGKRVGKMKASDSALHNPNEDEQDAFLNNIIKAVITNEGANGFSVDTLYSYSRVFPDCPLSYAYIAECGAKKLEQLANDKAIRCINNLQEPFTYAK